MCSLGIGARLAAPLGAPFLNQKQKKQNKRMGKKMEFWGTALAGFPMDAWQRESEHETVAPARPAAPPRDSAGGGEDAVTRVAGPVWRVGLAVNVVCFYMLFTLCS